MNPDTNPRAPRTRNGMPSNSSSEFLARVVPVAAYPGVLVIAFLTFAGLQKFGAPLTVIAYVPALLAALLITLHENFLPHRRAWQPSKGDVANDFGFMVLVQMLLPYFLSWILVLLAVENVGARNWTLEGFWPRGHPVWAQAIYMMLGADFLRYWLHRACHSTDILWRFHAVHHSPKKLYWLNVGRFHPLEKSVQYVCDTLPFVFLGVSADVLSVYFVFYAVNGFFQHSNCEVRLGLLNFIVSGPELHRWHHSRLLEESNNNYGNNLILWDLLFGTRFLPEGRQVGDLGLLNRDYPLNFVRQMATPFVKGLDKA